MPVGATATELPEMSGGRLVAGSANQTGWGPVSRPPDGRARSVRLQLGGPVAGDLGAAREVQRAPSAPSRRGHRRPEVARPRGGWPAADRPRRARGAVRTCSWTGAASLLMTTSSCEASRRRYSLCRTCGNRPASRVALSRSISATVRLLTSSRVVPRRRGPARGEGRISARGGQGGDGGEQVLAREPQPSADATATCGGPAWSSPVSVSARCSPSTGRSAGRCSRRSS